MDCILSNRILPIFWTLMMTLWLTSRWMSSRGKIQNSTMFSLIITYNYKACKNICQISKRGLPTHIAIRGKGNCEHLFFKTHKSKDCFCFEEGRLQKCLLSIFKLWYILWSPRQMDEISSRFKSTEKSQDHTHLQQTHAIHATTCQPSQLGRWYVCLP